MVCWGVTTNEGGLLTKRFLLVVLLQYAVHHEVSGLFAWRETRCVLFAVCVCDRMPGLILAQEITNEGFTSAPRTRCLKAPQLAADCPAWATGAAGPPSSPCVGPHFSCIFFFFASFFLSLARRAASAFLLAFACSSSSASQRLLSRLALALCSFRRDRRRAASAVFTCCCCALSTGSWAGRPLTVPYPHLMP